MKLPPPGLYVHLPWCERKCPYCDFNSYTSNGAFAERAYIDALLRDFEHELEVSGTRELGSVFIGGGTPSLFSGAAIGDLLEGLAARVVIPPHAEITLEANPGSAEAARFAAYRAAGVNRLSLGIQSFDDARLAALGRVHGAAEARAAIGMAQRAGFDNVNLDLMFGLPGAAPGDALADLRAALSFETAHLSWYQLTLEPGTAFARRPPVLPAHDDICDDYDAGLVLLAEAGYAHYEVSAHARPGRRARHNLNYWQFGDYLGIGAGAHGKLSGAHGIVRRTRIRQPERYMKTLVAGGNPASEIAVADHDLVSEYMLNALRLREGFTLEAFTARTGVAADDARLAAPLATALARGWLERDHGRIRPSALGFRFLDELQLLFVAGESALPPTARAS